MPDATDNKLSAADALIAAGIEVFGRDGYEGASNRALADAAGVNQALIAYHFGGKKELYLAVFRAMSQRVGQQFEQLAAEIESTLEASQHAEADMSAIALHCIERLIQRHVLLISQPEMQGYAKLIYREQLEPSEAFQLLYDGLIGRMMRLLSVLVAHAIGKPEPDDSDKISAIMLMGQVFVFRSARATVMHHMQWSTDIGPGELSQVQARLSLHVRGVLAVLKADYGSSQE